MRFGSSSIAKQYRVPRPTALPAGRKTILDRLPLLELLLVLLAISLLVLRPLQFAEAPVTERLLRALTRDSPATTTAIVRIDATPQGLQDCGGALQKVAANAGARLLVLMPPADTLCPMGATPGVSSVPVPPAATRLAADHHIIGWQAEAEQQLRPLHAAGLRFSPWVLPRRAASTPSMGLDSALADELPQTLLRDRMVIAEIAMGPSQPAQALANLIAAGLEGDQRTPAPQWFPALLALGLALLVIIADRLGKLWLLCASVSSCVAAISLGLFALKLHPEGVLPVIHLVVIGPLVGLGLRIPRLVANRRAIHYAADLMERAALMRSDGLHTIADEDFWPRVGDLAIQAHPAESVLVAELPAHEWHLRFWPYRGMGENVVKERRRDIRRTPYSNEDGTPEITVTRRFLVMEGAPAVVVPLIALGEIEGYVFLCGDSAERTYLRVPELAQRLSQDLGLMLRRRRIGKAGERKWRRQSRNARGPSFDTAQLVEGAELALGDLRIFNTLLRSAAVGLLYADTFGHVRVLGSAFSEWLQERGVTVPPSALSAPLLPGALMLGAILKVLRDSNDRIITLADVNERSEGVRFEVPLSARAGQPAQLTVFTLRALAETADGVSWTAGFVGTLTSTPLRAANDDGSDAETSTVRLPVDGGLDTLRVEALSERIRLAVRAAATASGRPIQFEPPRDLGHAIAYHDELADALIDLLYDTALKDAGGSGPVVTMEQGSTNVSIHMLDLLFGLPTAALRRTLLAPSDPPQGLEALSRFARTVAECHGHVELVEDEAGVRLTAHLLRARPLVRKPSLRPRHSSPGSAPGQKPRASSA